MKQYVTNSDFWIAAIVSIIAAQRIIWIWFV